jgi:hypothetical protein
LAEFLFWGGRAIIKLIVNFMSKTNKIIIILFVILAGLFLVWGWKMTKKSDGGVVEGASEQVVLAQVETISVNLVMEGLEGLPAVWEFKKDTNLLEALKELNQIHPSINLVFKDYGAMGVLVEQLGSRKNGTENKYWQYFVNDVQPMVGADKYVLQDRDRVEWRFVKSSF